MKDNDRNDDKPNAADNLTPTSTRENKNNKGHKSKSDADKSNRRQKKTFRAVWRSYSRVKQLEVVIAGLAAAGVVGYLIAYIVVSMKQNSQVQMQHMPLVINSRPPEFLQPFICDVRKGQLNTGNMRRFVKNIGDANAVKVNAFFFSRLKIIPEHKRGSESFDAPPVGNCNQKVGSVPVEFPLPPNIEKQIEIRQGAMTLPPLSTDEPIQLYDLECVYYWDEYGNSHGTCDTYRLLFPSTNPLDIISGSPTFFCDATPRIGKFREALIGHCEQ